MGGGAGPQIGQRKVLLNGHVGGSALERVLKQVSDDLAALVFRFKGDVLPAQKDATLIRDEAAGDGIEQGGFARAVGAHDGGKIACFHVQADPVQRHFFVDGAGVEGLVQVIQLKHFHLTVPPCRWSRGGCVPRACAARKQLFP